MLTSFSSAASADCLAQTGAENIVTFTVIAVVVMAVGFVLLRARVEGKRSLGALLLLGALAVGGLSALGSAATPAQAATSGSVCVEQSSTMTPTPTSAQTPLKLVFLGEEQAQLLTQVQLEDGESLGLQNGVQIDESLSQELEICEADAPDNCVTFIASSPVNALEELTLTGRDRKLTFSGVPSGYNVYLFGSTAPVDPFDPNGAEDVVESTPWVSSDVFSNGSTLNFSVALQKGD